MCRGSGRRSGRGTDSYEATGADDGEVVVEARHGEQHASPKRGATSVRPSEPGPEKFFGGSVG